MELLGANVCGNGTQFRVWVPKANSVEVSIETLGRPASTCAMTRDADGFYTATLRDVGAGDLYRYWVDGNGPFPDPASRFQPYGVHGPSQIVDWRHFQWTDNEWTGVGLEDTIIYELHVGTFTPEGTFSGVAARLPQLKELGVTAIELMPIADFPGRWNWGYDGVAPFAPARCYGAPDDLRRLVDEAHRLGLGVHLDVVYNHLGPDGAYQSVFSPYYHSQHHKCPWGASINFDGPCSESVRKYVIENALRWIHEYHFDALRLDATHSIFDESPRHILASMAGAVRHSLEGAERRVYLIAESVSNLAHMVKPESEGGWGLDGFWADDFHHQMRRALAGDSDGYFQDYEGTTTSIAATARQGWIYTGQYSRFFGKRRGTDPAGIPLFRFVIFLQNHDQIGNRAFGERLHHQIAPEAWRAASTLLLVLPETPLLFMGQEWSASAPFQYFIDHHMELGRQVTEGRRREFSRFTAFSELEARERIPDPQSEQTFLASRLNWDERIQEPHASALRLYRRLLALRRREPALRYVPGQRFDVEACGSYGLLIVRWAANGSGLLAVIHLRDSDRYELNLSPVVGPDRHWELVLTTEDAEFAPDPQPVRISRQPLAATFDRPGAALFRCRPGDDRT